MCTCERAPAQRLGDPRQRLAAVDQHLKIDPARGRRIAGSPQRSGRRRFQLIDPADTPQPATMMRTDRELDALTGPPIDTLNQTVRHRQSLPTAARPATG